MSIVLSCEGPLKVSKSSPITQPTNKQRYHTIMDAHTTIPGMKEDSEDICWKLCQSREFVAEAQLSLDRNLCGTSKISEVTSWSK